MSTLRFQCQSGCTRCCEVSGYVYLSEDDVHRITGYLNMSQASFEAQYLYRTKKLRRLRKPQKKGLECPFLANGGCSIHPVKPVQCRLFPFWPELVADRQAWQRTAEWCPGIGQGKLIQIGTALEVASEMNRAYPK